MLEVLSLSPHASKAGEEEQPATAIYFSASILSLATGSRHIHSRVSWPMSGGLWTGGQSLVGFLAADSLLDWHMQRVSIK